MNAHPGDLKPDERSVVRPRRHSGRKRKPSFTVSSSIEKEMLIGHEKPTISKPTKSKAKSPAESHSKVLENLLALEGELRNAETERVLMHFICNETRRLITYDQAAFFLVGLNGTSARMKAASGTSRIDANAPAVRALDRFVSEFLKNGETEKPSHVEIGAGEEKASRLRHALLVPLRLPDGSLYGVLLLRRGGKFTDAEATLVARLGGAYGHALSVFQTAKRRAAFAVRSRKLGLATLVLVAIALFIPVPFSAIAPMEITPKEPLVVAAPLDGVVDQIDISPGASVKAGDIIVRMNDTELSGALEIAERNYEVAIARYRRVSQGAAGSSDMRRDVAVTLAEVQLAQSEVESARNQFERTIIRADRDGVAIFSDADEWVGRPVATGERIMEIGDPNRINVTIELPVDDSALIGEDVSARAFLDADPLNSFPVEITRSAFRAEATADNRLAFMMKAELGDVRDDLRQSLRLGARGTARVSNGTVLLGYYVLRRPLAVLRKYTGL
ncbi:MAG: HlyD family efflux transporter periplasmic adaptor subunit [Pseudomonadota bacterium]